MMNGIEHMGRKMGVGFAYGFGALASVELFMTLHGSSVSAVLTAIGAK